MTKDELKAAPSICRRGFAILADMEIRPLAVADLDALAEIDATIESTRYLHLDRSGETVNITWKLDRAHSAPSSWSRTDSPTISG